MTRAYFAGKRRGRLSAGLLAFGGLTIAWPMLSAPAQAAATTEIYKCTDRSGNITYQNEKCPTGSQAGRVDIFDNNWTANRSEKDAQWQRNAADHRVVTGMPARWVREGFGEPAEVRDTTTGGAKELWIYNLPDRTLQIGMLDEQVQWFREAPVPPARGLAQAPTPSAPSTLPDARAAPAAPGTDAPRRDAQRPIDILQAPDALRSLDTPRSGDILTPNPSPRAPQETQSPRAVEVPRPAEVPRAPDAVAAPAALTADGTRRIARGRDCREVLAELGPPDRQREIPSDGGTSAMTEYVYEPSGSADPARTRILCANGRVEGVDRSVAH